MSPPLIPSAVDMTNAGNVVQARHELHRAIDFGGEPEQAAWSRKWGEASVAAGEKAAANIEDWDGFSLPRALEKANEAHTQLVTEINKDAPDIAKCRRLCGQIRTHLNSLVEAYEE